MGRIFTLGRDIGVRPAPNATDRETSSFPLAVNRSTSIASIESLRGLVYLTARMGFAFEEVGIVSPRVYSVESVHVQRHVSADGVRSRFSSCVTCVDGAGVNSASPSRSRTGTRRDGCHGLVNVGVGLKNSRRARRATGADSMIRYSTSTETGRFPNTSGRRFSNRKARKQTFSLKLCIKRGYVCRILYLLFLQYSLACLL